jgi:hypothetical protein
VAICLIAALVAVEPHDRIPILGVIWGTTIGLALAHLFAFRLATRLVGGEAAGTSQGRLALASMVGAAAVAVIASAPVLVLSDPAQADGARLFMSGLIGFAAYQVGRTNGAGTARSTLFAAGSLLLATAVAIIKNYLVGH